MTSPAHQYPGNERWGIHCHPPDPDHCPGCWCQPLRTKLEQLVGAAGADRLLAADTLLIELHAPPIGRKP